MINYPKISVILPTYNRPEYLLRAINSIINQTYKKIEIIIIDDSNDQIKIEDNKRLINKLNNQKIKYIKTDSPSGGSGARNLGIENANGEYIAFIDDDDEWLPTKLERQLEQFSKSELDNLGLVYCNYIIIDVTKNPNPKNKIRETKRGDIFKDLLNRMCVGVTSTYLIKKEVFNKIGNFDTNLKSAQDYDLPLRISEHYNIDLVDEYLVNKYEDDKRISTNFKNKLRGINYFQKKHREKYKKLKVYLRVYNYFRFTLLKISYLLGIVFGNNILKIQNKLVGLLR